MALKLWGSLLLAVIPAAALEVSVPKDGSASLVFSGENGVIIENSIFVGSSRGSQKLVTSAKGAVARAIALQPSVEYKVDGSKVDVDILAVAQQVGDKGGTSGTPAAPSLVPDVPFVSDIQIIGLPTPTATTPAKPVEPVGGGDGAEEEPSATRTGKIPRPTFVTIPVPPTEETGGAPVPIPMPLPTSGVTPDKPVEGAPLEPDVPAPAKPVEPDVPAPVKPVEPDVPKPAEPVEPDVPAPVEPAEPVKSEEPVPPLEPLKPTEPTEPTEPAKPEPPVVAPPTEEEEEDEDQIITTAAFTFASGDHLYGIWEYPFNGAITNEDVTFDVKGLYGDQPGVNYANARAPFFFSKSGFGVYVDTLSMGTFSFSEGRANFSFKGDAKVKYTVLFNPDLKSLLKQYANLSSKPEMVPDSGFGPIFWSDNMEQDFHGNVSNAEENYYDIADHLLENEIRATGMFADRPYGTGNMSWGNFDFDPVFYPDPKSLIANLSSMGYDFQVWVANRAFYNTTLYKDAIKNDWLFPGINGEEFMGPALNLSIPEAYDYFKEKLSYFTDLGVKGFKIDRGEEHEMPDSQQNIQNSLFDQLCYEVMTEKWGSSTNFFTFTRSAVDKARSLAAIWNGDPHATFEGLAYSVASGIRAGLLLFSTWGSDVGGYVRPDANSPSEELWARWMQFGAFSPMYEIMVGTGHTPWYEPYTDALVDVLKMTADWHTKLIPYIRSYTAQAVKTGIPVMRALFLEYPADDKAYTASDSYAFGAEFFVAPFVSGGGSRTVHFPSAAAGKKVKFLDWFDKKTVFTGGVDETITLPLTRMPVYVREGAIVPTGDVYKGNAAWIENWAPSLEIEFYPSYAVNTSLFEFAREDGTSAMISMRTDKAAETVSIAVQNLGTTGKFKVYTKTGTADIAFNGAMSVTMNRVVTLFD